MTTRPHWAIRRVAQWPADPVPQIWLSGGLLDNQGNPASFLLKEVSDHIATTAQGAVNPRDKTYSVVLFPFLKTSSPVRLGSLEFRSTDDIDGLPQGQAASVAEIANMLFASGNQRIERASFAIVDRVDLWSWSDPVCLDALSDIEAVVAYLYAYASPRHGFSNIFLTPEHASIVVLTPNRVAPVLMRSDFNVINVGEHVDLDTDAAGFVDGYDGILGLRHRFWVASGSRVYGTTPRPTLNISQDLASDVQQSSCARADYHLLFQLLMERGQNGDLRRQVFTAVRWFNRANSEHRAEAESFICLSVALETLLRVPHKAKKDRFVDAIALLLGRVPRLDDWAKQFYEARSRAVHEGHVGQVAFIQQSSKQKKATTYQSLLAYGREVFQLCLGTVLTGASLSSNADLAAKLIANSERFETVCRTLNDDSIPLAMRLEQIGPLASEINRYQDVSDTGLAMPAMLGACRAAARVTLESSPDTGEGLRNALAAMADAPRTDNCLEQLGALRALVDELNKLPDLPPARWRYAMITLVNTTWDYLLPNYVSIKRRVDGETDTSDG